MERMDREEVCYCKYDIEDLPSNRLFYRAAERYADLTPEALARRRERGWGETIHDTVNWSFEISSSRLTLLARATGAHRQSSAFARSN